MARDAARVTRRSVGTRGRIGPATTLLVAAVACGPAAEDAPPDPYAAPAGAPYTAEEVTVRTPGGLSLAGTLTLPVDAGAPVPAVLTITGSGRQNRDEQLVRPAYRPFRQIADTLGRRGVAVLRLDDRGVGGSDAGPPDATSFDRADDMRAALAWLRERPEIDPGRLAVVGHSEGGVIAPMIAATDSALAGVVLLAGPAYTLRRISLFQRRTRLEMEAGGSLSDEPLDREMERMAEVADVTAARDPWESAVWAYDPLPTAREVAAPVLILQGESDMQITPEQADTLAAAFRNGGNADVTLRTFPETNHLFLADPDGSPAGYGRLPSYALRPEVLGTIADWLADRLDARR